MEPMCWAVLASKNSYDAIDCKKCGYVHIVPPKDDEINDYYQTTFYSDYKPDYMKLLKKILNGGTKISVKNFSFLKVLSPSSGKKILDIGSGPGFFLKYAKENGWDPLGIEPGASAVQFSKSLGVNVIQDSIYNILDLRLMPFDVVYSNQTFEHLVYPNACLRKISPNYQT